MIREYMKKRPDFLPHFIVGAVAALLSVGVGSVLRDGAAALSVFALAGAFIAGVGIELSQYIGWPRKGQVDYMDVVHTVLGAVPLVLLVLILA